MVIVLITRGKYESIDWATVRCFSSYDEAEEYCKTTSTGKQKYWTNAEIVQDGYEVELMQPEE